MCERFLHGERIESFGSKIFILDFRKKKIFQKFLKFFFNLRAQKSAFKLLAENEAAKLRANDTVGAESDSKQGGIFICNDS